MATSVLDTYITRFLFQTDRAGLRRAERQLSGTFATIAGRARQAARAAGAIATGLAGAGAGVYVAGQSAERAFIRMQTQLGMTADETARVKAELLSLSRETAQPLAQLADGFFLLRSNEIPIMDALSDMKNAAYGAMAELGTSTDIANLVSSARVSLGEKEVTNILAGGIKGGKIDDAGQVAAVMGQLLPFASSLDISFKDLMVGVAGYSKQGINPAQAATALRGILGSLLDPSQQAQDILKSLPGKLTPDDLKQMVKTQGWIAVLQDLKAQLNDQDFAKIIGRLEGLGLALDVTGSNKGNYDSVADAIDDAIKLNQVQLNRLVVMETGFFKASKAANDFRVTLQLLYDSVLVPILDFFAKLPPLIQNVIVSGLALGIFAQLTGLGPALGKIVSALGGLVKVLYRLSGWLFGALLGRAAVSRLTRRLRRMVVMGLLALLGGRISKRMAIRLAIMIGTALLAAFKAIPLAIGGLLLAIGLAIWIWWDEIKLAVKNFVADIKQSLHDMMPDWVKRVFGIGGVKGVKNPNAPGAGTASNPVVPVQMMYTQAGGLVPSNAQGATKSSTINVNGITVYVPNGNPQAVAQHISAALKTEMLKVAEDVNSQVMF